MATTVLGASPVTFISEDTEPGTQFQIPLSTLTITSTGTVDSSGWTPPATLATNDSALVPVLLADLLARGVIWAGS